MSRFWCLVVSSVIFSFAQLGGAVIENPNFLFFLSGATGSMCCFYLPIAHLGSLVNSLNYALTSYSGLRLPLRRLPIPCR